MYVEWRLSHICLLWYTSICWAPGRGLSQIQPADLIQRLLKSFSLLKRQDVIKYIFLRQIGPNWIACITGQTEDTKPAKATVPSSCSLHAGLLPAAPNLGASYATHCVWEECVWGPKPLSSILEELHGTTSAGTEASKGSGPGVKLPVFLQISEFVPYKQTPC